VKALVAKDGRALQAFIEKLRPRFGG